VLFRVDAYTDTSAVITVGENLDFRTAPEFKILIQDLTEFGIRNFILDFSDTATFDSTGLGSIFLLHRKIAEFEGKIIFAAPSKTVQSVVEMTRLYNVFPQSPSVQLAQISVSSSAE